MNKLTFIIVLLSSVFCIAQNVKTENTYLHFDSTSTKTYLVEINGKKVKEKFYKKEIKENGNIKFYIEKEMFLSTKEADTLPLTHLKSIKFSKMNYLKGQVENTNPLYPYKVFPNLFLIEKNTDSTIIKYKVQWKYYIE